MRKILWSALCLALVFLATWALTRSQPADPSSASPAASPASFLSRLAPGLSTAGLLRAFSLPEPSASPRLLRRGTDTEIFSALFPVRRWQHWNEAATVSAARDRFRQAYPAETIAHHGSPAKEAELRARLGILKAFQKQKLHARETRAFFADVALNAREDLAVRRQALENLRPLLATLSDDERSSFLGRLSPQLISLAASSERELLNEVLESRPGARRPSESTEVASLNKWENLPCPTPEQFREFARRVSWAEGLDYTCDLSNTGKFGRLLLLAASLELPVDDSMGEVGKNLRNPLEFIEKRSKKMMIDLNQSDTIAFNRVTIQEIHLGAIFFADPPLDSLGTLIHEARHSDMHEDQGHETCVQGDIPRTPGGCDGVLTEQKDAGAYSYGVFFNLVLARSGKVAESDREWLESDALINVLRRFNQLVPRLAHFQDGLAGLNEKGELLLVHPFAAGFVQPAGLEGRPAFKRISFDYRSGGLHLFGERGKARLWSWGKAAKPYYDEFVPATVDMHFAGKGRLPYRDYAFSMYSDRSGGLFYMEFDKDAGHYVPNPYPLRPSFSPQEFFLGALTRTYFRSAEGKIFHAREWGNDPADFLPVLPNAPAFRQASGGTLQDALHLVGEDGVLYYQEAHEEQLELDGVSDGQTPPSALELKRAEFQAGKPAVAYHEGTVTRFTLDDEGAVWVGYHGLKSAPVRLALPEKLTQISFVKLLQTHGPLDASARLAPLAGFERRCGVEKAERDPFFQRGVGVAQGKLLFEGDDGRCLSAELPAQAQGKVASFRFRSEWAGADAREAIHFNRLTLEVQLQNGETLSILPYTGRTGSFSALRKRADHWQ